MHAAIKFGANCYDNVCYSDLFSNLILKEINAFLKDLYKAWVQKMSRACCVFFFRSITQEKTILDSYFCVDIHLKGR